jgi:hypothetical protein
MKRVKKEKKEREGKGLRLKDSFPLVLKSSASFFLDSFSVLLLLLVGEEEVEEEEEEDPEEEEEGDTDDVCSEEVEVALASVDIFACWKRLSEAG